MSSGPPERASIKSDYQRGSVYCISKTEHHTGSEGQVEGLGAGHAAGVQRHFGAPSKTRHLTGPCFGAGRRVKGTPLIERMAFDSHELLALEERADLTARPGVQR
jgi:hypothetical protein